MRVVTHSGPFHADEVFAYALLRVILGEPLDLVRTRDPRVIADADLVIDVGGAYDPERRRFDHHQRSYHGALSSAGMVLRWLEHMGNVSSGFARQLRQDWVEYIDAVDTGRRRPGGGVPCISSIVAVLADQASSPEEMDTGFVEATKMCEGILRGLCVREHAYRLASSVVPEAMRCAEASGSRVLVFGQHQKWQRAYFEHGGAHHPSDFVLYPDADGTWVLICIPDERRALGCRRALPSEWAGLAGEQLVNVAAVPGALFCHKNRFMAGFSSESAARAAIARWGLDRPSDE